MKEYIAVSEIQVGDTIDTTLGYTYTVTNIVGIKSKNESPKLELTIYTNIDDSKKEIKEIVHIGEYVKRIAKNFEYEPQIKLNGGNENE